MYTIRCVCQNYKYEITCLTYCFINQMKFMNIVDTEKFFTAGKWYWKST